ncbi:MAG TPA: hypothetical protein VJO14_06620, partial [Bacteroidota bacterium]|nr:hypothetical protein [Bacteroidota bacterium]
MQSPMIAVTLALTLSGPFGGPGGGRLFAQEVSATARADTNSMKIGEQLRIKISVAGPSGYVLRNLAPADSLEGLEIVRVDS